MSQALVQTKNRIKSVNSISKITKAMKLVSSAKLRAQMKRLEGTKAYSQEICEILSFALTRTDENFESPYGKENNSNKNLYILVTSSLGMCGPYNYNLYHYFDEIIKDKDDAIIIGNKGKTHYKKPIFTKKEMFDEYNDSGNLELASRLSEYISNIYLTGEYKEIHLVYTEYRNSISFVPKDLTVLPIKMEKDLSKERLIEPLLEPSPEEVINLLLPIYLNSVVASKLNEAALSEQASRRNAMENATENAETLAKELELEYNKARQSAITNEIIEVVSASNNVQGGQ